MGTTDTIDAESAKTIPVDADEVAIYDSATGRTKKMTYVSWMGVGLAPVNTTATTLAVTQAAHGGRYVTISSAAPIAVTLPQATGTGTVYKFQMQVAATATTSTIKVGNSTDVMQGIAYALTTTSPFAENWGTSASSDTITMNGGTLGGAIGDVYEITDVKTGFFSVVCKVSQTGTFATPFSATV